MIRTQIQLTEEQSTRIKHIAARRGVSMATVIRQAVDRTLEEDDQGDRWEQALSVVGKFHSGKNDIGENHDQYLADDFA